MQALDRHALVMAVWLPSGLIAVALLHHGLTRASAAFTLAGFGAVVAGFVGHVVVNACCGTGFSVRERALGLVLYAAALAAFGLAALLRAGFAARGGFLPISAGFILVFACAVFAMLARSGARGAFASFDVIRTFRPPAARGGGE